MLIREAITDDVSAIARISVDTWRATYRGIVPDERLHALSYEERAGRYRELIAFPDAKTFFYVAEVSPNRIVGFIAGGQERSGDSHYRGEIYQLYVRDDYQRQGIGRALMRCAVERLSEMGFKSFMLWVFAHNPYRGFYDKLGGRLIRDRLFEWEGITYRVVAYGWEDTAVILREDP